MGRLIIHPTHRRLLRQLRERNKEGRPVILLIEERNCVFEELPLLKSATARNQCIYRVLLRAMRRSITEIEHRKGLIVLNNRNIDVIEREYAKVERRHLCLTVISSLELSLRRKRVRYPRR